MNSLRLLFLARHVPWPLDGGAKIRNYYLLRILSEVFAVELVAAGSPHSEIRTWCAKVRATDESASREAASLSKHLRTAVSFGQRRHSAWFEAQTSETLRALAKRYCQERGPFDVVHVSELGMAAGLPKNVRGALVYDAHNCESQLLARRAKIERWPMSLFLQREATKIAHIEAALVSQSDLVLTNSASDRSELATLSYCRDTRISIVPHPIDLDYYQPVRNTTPDPATIAVTGSFDWKPNRQGLEWFIRQVMPELRRASEGIKPRVVVAGRMPLTLHARLATIEDVEVIANPGSMVEVLGRATVVAIPVLVSSGTRLRMLEAFAARRAVVTTSSGARGAEGASGTHWLAADNPQDFALALRQLLLDEALRLAIVEQAWQMVRSHDWRSMKPLVLGAYHEILNQSLRTLA